MNRPFHVYPSNSHFKQLQIFNRHEKVDLRFKKKIVLLFHLILYIVSKIKSDKRFLYTSIFVSSKIFMYKMFSDKDFPLIL